MAQVHDDWEVAVDTGEFDKQLEQHEKDRAANQEPLSQPSTATSSVNFLPSNKPIRILKRPGSRTPLTSTNTETAPAMISPFADDPSSSSQVLAPPVILAAPSSSQSNRIPVKTYEQRELEYRLARRRIMGEEESPEQETKTDESNLLSNETNLRTSAPLDSSS